MKKRMSACIDGFVSIIISQLLLLLLLLCAAAVYADNEVQATPGSLYSLITAITHLGILFQIHTTRHD